MNGSHSRGALPATMAALFTLLFCADALRPAQAQTPDPSGYTSLPGTFFTGYTPISPAPLQMNGSVFYSSTVVRRKRTA